MRAEEGNATEGRKRAGRLRGDSGSAGPLPRWGGAQGAPEDSALGVAGADLTTIGTEVAQDGVLHLIRDRRLIVRSERCSMARIQSESRSLR